MKAVFRLQGNNLHKWPGLAKNAYDVFGAVRLPSLGYRHAVCGPNPRSRW
jgi:hypothetical protein